MKRNLAIMVSALALALAPSSEAQLFGKKDVHDVLIVENVSIYAGTASDIYTPTVTYVLKDFVEGHTKASRRNDPVLVLMTDRPSRQVFQGTRSQLYEEAPRILKDAELKKRCNDLVRVFDQLENYIDKEDVEHLDITYIGTGIHVPLGCSANSSVSVPQDMPEELKLSRILKGMKSASFTSYLIHDDQEGPLLSYLAPAKLDSGDLVIYRAEATATLIGYQGAPEGEAP